MNTEDGVAARFRQDELVRLNGREVKVTAVRVLYDVADSDGRILTIPEEHLAGNLHAL